MQLAKKKSRCISYLAVILWEPRERAQKFAS
jgi:hypothetical protein